MWEWPLLFFRVVFEVDYIDVDVEWNNVIKLKDLDWVISLRNVVVEPNRRVEFWDWST